MCQKACQGLGICRVCKGNCFLWMAGFWKATFKRQLEVGTCARSPKFVCTLCTLAVSYQNGTRGMTVLSQPEMYGLAT